jgi:hypothetical protein
MEDVLKSDVPIVSEIFTFITGAHEKDLQDLEAKINGFIERKTEEICNLEENDKTAVLNSLKNHSFFKLSEYNRSKISDNDLIMYVMRCAHLQRDLLKKFFPVEEVKDDYCLKRQVSPPLEAYEYRGDSTGVKQSNKSYGLLFF